MRFLVTERARSQPNSLSFNPIGSTSFCFDASLPDINRDSKLDVVATCSSGGTYVYYQNTPLTDPIPLPPTFTNTSLSGTSYWAVAVGDMVRRLLVPVADAEVAKPLSRWSVSSRLVLLLHSPLPRSSCHHCCQCRHVGAGGVTRLLVVVASGRKTWTLRLSSLCTCLCIPRTTTAGWIWCLERHRWPGFGTTRARLVLPSR